MNLKSIQYLYHGSNAQFVEFDMKKASQFKDFGIGFYLTSNRNQAQNWALQKAKGNTPAFLYIYSIQGADFSDCKVLELLEYNDDWVEFLCQNRIYGCDHDYDIVYDRMADNKFKDISDSLQKYDNGELTATDVVSRIKWKQDDFNQFCLHTHKSICKLKLLQRVSIRDGRIEAFD